MKKTISILIVILLGYFSTIDAQKKQLTLEESVAQRFSKFYPRGVSQLQWIKNKQAISYASDDNNALLSKEYPFFKVDTLINIDELNEIFELELTRLPRITWLDSNSVYFIKNRIYYRLNTTVKEGDKWTANPNGANIDFHKSTGHIAYTIKNNLNIQSGSGDTIIVTNNEDPNLVSGQAIARQEFGIVKGTFWSPKGAFLAFYQKSEANVTDYPIIDISSTPAKVTPIKYPMAGQKNEIANVGIYNMTSDTTYYIEVDTSKDQFLTNVSWGPNEKYLYVVIVNRNQNHIWVNQYDASNGKMLKTLFEETHDKYVEPEHQLWFIPGSNEEFLWYSERDGFTHLYRYNTNGELLNQVTSGRWVTLSILGLDKSGDNIYVTGTDTTGLNNHLYRVGLKNSKVEDLTTDEGIHRFSLSSDGTYFIDRFSNITTPSATQILDYHGRNLKLLKLSKNPLAEYDIPKPEFSDLKADDGTILHTRMIKPTNFDSLKKYPVIVYVYGGPHAQMISNSFLGGAALWMYHAAQKGYLVYTLDNRGSSRRGFEFENIIHRQLGTVEMADQLVGVNYLKSLPYVDTSKMAIHGWSFGGFMTTSMMLRQPGTFQVGVAGGPVTDWRYYEIMYGERYMDMPQENEDGYDNNLLSNYTQQLEGDLLLIHGAVDPVVVPQHSLSLLKSFVDNKTQVDFFTYPMHPHNVRGIDRVHLIRKVLDYIDEKLK